MVPQLVNAGSPDRACLGAGRVAAAGGVLIGTAIFRICPATTPFGIRTGATGKA